MTHEVAFEAHPQRMLRTVAADDLVPFALGAIPIIALGFANGGFYAKSWSWATLGLAVALVVGCAAARPSAWPRPLAFLAILGALGAWIILSSLWSRSASLTVPEAQRVLLYIVGVASAALIVRAARWRFLFLGVTSGLSFVVVWGLASYLLGRERPPAQFEGYLLHTPMGYANAMAIATVMAIVAVLGFATNGALPAVRFGSALLLVPLTSALALTGSRAAWGALIVGCLVAVGSSPGPWGTLRAWSVLLTIPAVAALVVSLADLDDATIGRNAGGPCRRDRSGFRGGPHRDRCDSGPEGHPAIAWLASCRRSHREGLRRGHRHRGVDAAQVGGVQESYPSDGSGSGEYGTSGWFVRMFQGAGPGDNFRVFAICVPASQILVHAAGCQYGG